jgi:ADP-ribosylglycohydrolase/protein-tyrosine phosphatase
MRVPDSLSHPLEIATVQAPGEGAIGLTICPGKRHDGRRTNPWARDMAVDLALIRDWGASALVTLMEGQELRDYEAQEIGTMAEALGLDWHHLPIPDLNPPGQEFEALWTWSGLRLRAALRRGERVLVHCLGGRGRSGTIAARLLGELGVPAQEAIAAVRAARPGAIETSAQLAHAAAIATTPEARDAFASRLLGCLFGGAVGDGFGYAVEFDRLEEIRGGHGPAGLRAPVLDREGRLIVSDDTQMTLFTLEGALAGGDREASIRRACLDWLDTQSGRHPAHGTGALAQHKVLRVRRAPGTTCLSALHAGGTGSTVRPINDSKGCGAAMRIAALAFVPGLDVAGSYALAAACGAQTHGHPDGWGAAGLLAATLRAASAGVPLAAAYEGAIAAMGTADLGGRPNPVIHHRALALAARGVPKPEELKAELGEGWTGDEAVAIGLCAAIAAPDFASCLALAANHDGDSDSTASIAGQAWGAAHGAGAVPQAWVRRLDVLEPLSGLAARAVAAWSPG